MRKVISAVNTNKQQIIDRMGKVKQTERFRIGSHWTRRAELTLIAIIIVTRYICSGMSLIVRMSKYR